MSQLKADFLTNLRVYTRRMEVEIDQTRAENAWDKLSNSPVFGRSRKEPLYAAARMAGLPHVGSVGVAMYLYQVWYSDADIVSGMDIHAGVTAIMAVTPAMGTDWPVIWAGLLPAEKAAVTKLVLTAMKNRGADKTPPPTGFETLTALIKRKARGY